MAGHPVCQEAASLRGRQRHTVGGLVSVGIAARRAGISLCPHIRRFASIRIAETVRHLPSQKLVTVLATAYISARLSPFLTSLALINGQLPDIAREGLC